VRSWDDVKQFHQDSLSIEVMKLDGRFHMGSRVGSTIARTLQSGSYFRSRSLATRTILLNFWVLIDRARLYVRPWRISNDILAAKCPVTLTLKDPNFISLLSQRQIRGAFGAYVR
jgi:hypothetical protein